MQIFEQNIGNIFGIKGKAWLKKIPDIVQKLQNYWNLSNLFPVENMTFNYVMKGIKENKEPIILKIAPSESFIQNEIKALQAFDRHGCVYLFDYNTTHHAILLQRAIPGTTLKSLYPQEEDLVMDAYIQAMQAMHSIFPPNKDVFPHIRNWLMAIDKANSIKILHDLYKRLHE